MRRYKTCIFIITAGIIFLFSDFVYGVDFYTGNTYQVPLSNSSVLNLQGKNAYLDSTQISPEEFVAQISPVLAEYIEVKEGSKIYEWELNRWLNTAENIADTREGVIDIEIVEVIKNMMKLYYADSKQQISPEEFVAQISPVLTEYIEVKEGSKIYEWELNRWYNMAENIANTREGVVDAEVVEIIKGMIELRKELKPLAEEYHYFIQADSVLPEGILLSEDVLLREWQDFSNTIERIVSTVKGQMYFMPAGISLEEAKTSVACFGKELNSNTGYRMDYNKDNNKAFFTISDLAGDLTQISAIRFYIKSQTQQIRIYLNDSQGKYVGSEEGIDITNYIKDFKADGSNWNFINIPLEDLKKEYSEVDWSSIEKIGINIYAKKEANIFLPNTFNIVFPKEGQLFIRDMFFVDRAAVEKSSLEDVKANLNSMILSKNELENLIGRPLMMSVLEDRVMFEEFNRTGTIKIGNTTESIDPYVYAYYNRYFQPENVKNDSSVLSYFYSVAEEKGIEEAKKQIALAFIFKPFVEKIIGILTIGDSSDEGKLSGVIENKIKEITQECRGGFLFYKDILNGIRTVFGSEVMSQTDIIKVALNDLTFALTLIESVEILAGRRLDFNDADDMGFLMFWASEIRNQMGGIEGVARAFREIEKAKISQDYQSIAFWESKFKEAIDYGIEEVKFYARFFLVSNKLRGHINNFLDDPDSSEKKDLQTELSIIWKEHCTGKFNLMSAMELVNKFQKFERSLAFFSTELPFAEKNISTDVTRKGEPVAKFEYDLASGKKIILPIIKGMGNWVLSSQFKLGMRTDEGSQLNLRMIITNELGQQAVFEINNITDKWEDIKIPLWGPYEVDWMTEEENKMWKEALLSEKLWDKNTMTLKKDSDIKFIQDELTDWSNVKKVEFQVMSSSNSSGNLYLNGIYTKIADNSSQSKREYLETEGKKWIDSGGAIVIGNDLGQQMVIVGIKGNNKKVSFIPAWPISPVSAQGFFSLRRSIPSIFGPGEPEVLNSTYSELKDRLGFDIEGEFITIMLIEKY